MVHPSSAARDHRGELCRHGRIFGILVRRRARKQKMLGGPRSQLILLGGLWNRANAFRTRTHSASSRESGNAEKMAPTNKDTAERDGDDKGALIYRESQLRKAAEATAAAERKRTSKRKKILVVNHQDNTSTSTESCKTSKRKRLPSNGNEGQIKKKVRRGGGHRTLCSKDGCTNQVVKGGVCIRHGAKVKLCSSEGCTNQAIKRRSVQKAWSKG